MNITSNLVRSFDPISLDQMDSVKLMSRIDVKFIFELEKINELFEKLTNFYNILEIKDKRIHDYKSLYYDTLDRKFYVDHHNKRVNRNKVRFREYIDTGLTFLEVKHKNNKGRTVKKRTKVDRIPVALLDSHREFITNIIGNSFDVIAKQWILFSRITLVHKKKKERLTLDLDLTFYDKNDKGDLQDLVIAEVKQEKTSNSSDFVRIAKEMRIFPMRISKYCISSINLNPDLKYNRFKKKILFINKLKQKSCKNF